MKKLKSMIKLSDRDRKLLVLLLAVAIIGLAYIFGYQKLSDKVSKYQTEITSLQKKQRDLKEKNNNKAKYESDTKEYKNQTDVLLKRYANGNTQPATIDFLNQIESTTGAWIKSVSFSEPTAIYTFGQKATSNPSSSGAAYNTDMVGYKVSLNLAYEGEYDQWKNLVNYINTYDSKNAIENISMTYSEVTNTVSGTLTVSTYSIVSKDRKFTDPYFDVEIGTNNIFSAN